MKRKRDGFVPLGDVALRRSQLPGDRALARRADTPPARRHFTTARPGHAARAREGSRSRSWGTWRGCSRCAACRARTQATGLQYIRRNGPYTLIHDLPRVATATAALRPSCRACSWRGSRLRRCERKAASSSWVIHCPSSCGSSTSTAPSGKAHKRLRNQMERLVQGERSCPWTYDGPHGENSARGVNSHVTDQYAPVVGARREAGCPRHYGKARSNLAKSFSRKSSAIRSRSICTS